MSYLRIIYSYECVALTPRSIFNNDNTEAEYTVKPVCNGQSKKRSQIGFQDLLSLNAGQKYCSFDLH